MSTNESNGKFVANEYRSITVNADLEPLYRDCYRNFGWIPVGVPTSDIYGTVSMKYKRDRKIKNKQKVNELQQRCEAAFQSIDKLDAQKTSSAITAALAVGLIGTVFMALAVFSFLAGGGFIILSVLFGIIGFVGWGVPYFLYQKTKAKRTAQLNPRIDEQYDVIYDACEQASALLRC